MTIESIRKQMINDAYPTSSEQIEEKYLSDSIKMEEETHEWIKRIATNFSLDTIEERMMEMNPTMTKEEAENNMDEWRKLKEYTEEDWDNELNSRIEKAKERFENIKKKPEWQAYIESTQKISKQMQIEYMMFDTEEEMQTNNSKIK